MMVVKYMLAILIGLGSGVVVSGGVFAFIAIIGVVPRLAQKTGTEKHIMVYEDAMMAGGIFGTSTMFINYHLPIGKPAVIILFLAMGVFFGCLAVSLAEVLDVIPVFTRHTRIRRGIPIFITILAIGKLVGSLLYYFVPNFY